MDISGTKTWYSSFKEFFFGKEKPPITPREATIDEQAQHIFESLKQLGVTDTRYGGKRIEKIMSKFRETNDPQAKRDLVNDLRQIWRNNAPKGLKMMDLPPKADPIKKESATYDNLKVVGDKRFGVEPGFESVKEWTIRDTQKLNFRGDKNANPPIPPHKFHQRTLDTFNEGEFYIGLDGQYDANGLCLEDYLDENSNLTLSDVLENLGLLDDMIQRLKESSNLTRKFTKKHFVKLTYGEPEFGKKWSNKDTAKLNKVGSDYYKCAIEYLETKYQIRENSLLLLSTAQSGKSIPLSKIISLIGKEEDDVLQKVKSHIMGNLWKVYIPTERAVKKFGKVGGKIYQSSTAETAREKNYSAITEALANDIYTALNFGGQKLTLRQSQYESGYPKLLLDGTEVQGSQGEQFSTLEGYIKKGRLVGNAIHHKDGNIYPVDTKQLASYLIKSLLMGDRDKVGSAGANVGFVIENGKAVIMNIDPGKAMPSKPSKGPESVGGKTDLMEFRNLNSDFSFDNTDATFADRRAKGYKNFTIFSDTTLAEKMYGMREVIENWDKVVDIFDKYLKFFDRHDKTDPLDFGKEIEETFVRLRNRKKYFEEVFADRLKMQRLNERGVVAQDDEMLEVLDNLEKLTSNTRAKVREDIPLVHLQVIPSSRKEWEPILTRQKDFYRTDGFIFTGTKQEVRSVHERLMRYVGKRLPKGVKVTYKLDPHKDEGFVEINIKEIRGTRTEYNKFRNLFSETKIAQHKGQKLYGLRDKMAA
jgi:hypothetical protein